MTSLVNETSGLLARKRKPRNSLDRLSSTAPEIPFAFRRRPMSLQRTGRTRAGFVTGRHELNLLRATPTDSISFTPRKLGL